MRNRGLILILLVTFIFGTVCYFILPDMVAVDWEKTEGTRTIPKLRAILTTYLIAVLGVLCFGKLYDYIGGSVTSKNILDKSFDACRYFLLFIGLFYQILFLIINL